MIHKINIIVIEKYIVGIKQKHHRFNSWDHCFKVFSDKDSKENRPLHLAFYLASWGMYRGSSGLLQKNYLVHEVAVAFLVSDKFKLRCSEVHDVTKDSVIPIMNLKGELSVYYRNLGETAEQGTVAGVSTTDTLMSKILLGTLACVPAYDRFFIDGLKISGFKERKFNEASLYDLINFIEYNDSEIILCQQMIKESTAQCYYPKMKVVDMYFWQIGYDNWKSKKAGGKG